MSINPFRPTPNATKNAAVATSASSAAKITDAPGNIQVRVMNNSNVTAWIVFGDGTVAASTAANIPIGSGGTEVFTVECPAGGLYFSVIGTGTPSGNVYVTPGVGI